MASSRKKKKRRGIRRRNGGGIDGVLYTRMPRRQHTWSVSTIWLFFFFLNGRDPERVGKLVLVKAVGT
jgi:hypothetical protein